MRIRSLRIATQTFFFIITWAGLIGISMTGLIYPYFFCVASPGAWAGCPIGVLEQGFSTLATTGLLVLAFLVAFLGVLTLPFGRAFCGWACPIGFLNEIIYHLRKYFLPALRPFGGIAEKLAKPAEKYGITPRYYKYIILAMIPVASFITGEFIFTDICPMGGITATLPTLLMGGYRPDTLFPVKIFLVVMWLVIGVVMMRSWCKYLCPLGAAFAPMNKISLMRLEYDPGKCVHCNLCIKACPMDVDIFNDNRSLECILCGRCVE
ncbi:MAG: 4Fe-4S binding protein, partial [Thermoplasmata archaeon]|nr:4Fe-4S binding protein [Thermoplasmata archaeon]